MDKFVKFEDALEKLGISSERLNQLREEGELRAYRDGASWKFRADEIERMAQDGVPDAPPPSDIGLVDPSELVDASPLEDLPELDDLELSLASDDDLTAEGAAKRAARDAGGSELELDLSLEDDTVTAGGSDASIELDAGADDPSDPSDSILLSDEALGESLAAPPSTIIGKSELEAKDADLELATDEPPAKRAPGSSEVLVSGVAGSGVLDDETGGSGNTSAFRDLEELELDLAAESSRILSPEDAQGPPASPASAQPASAADSDLSLSDVQLAGEDEGTDPIPEELASKSAKPKGKDKAASSDLELATDDDELVLADSGGSDITLDSADSGINLISPADSGLALDDIPLEIGGSAILDSLNLGGEESDVDISLMPSDVAAPRAPAAKLQEDDDFRLTPLGDRDDDGDSSSQVIALDAGMEDLAAGDGGILAGGDDMFAEVADGAGLEEDQVGIGDELGGEYAPVVPRSDSEYSVMNILGLGACLVLLLLGVMLMLDMVRNVWSWEHNLALNDSLLDSILRLFGLT